MNSFGPFSRKAKILLAILAGGLIFSVGVNIALLSKIKKIEHPGQVAADETKKIIADIAKIIVLPTDESPTLATVSDTTKLKDQKFFAHAEIGDKVLLYQASQKAILWRPSTKKIIEISSLTAKSGDSTSSLGR